jgi:hypothetical protein
MESIDAHVKADDRNFTLLVRAPEKQDPQLKQLDRVSFSCSQYAKFLL